MNFFLSPIFCSLLFYLNYTERVHFHILLLNLFEFIYGDIYFQHTTILIIIYKFYNLIHFFRDTYIRGTRESIFFLFFSFFNFTLWYLD